MRNLSTIFLVLLWVMSFGCKQEKIIPELVPGREKLLGAGRAVEAVQHLKLAEMEEDRKEEPRALLLIAYSHALSENLAWLKNENLVNVYQNEKEKRLAELNDAEIDEILKILNERHRVQKDVIQILIDKGLDVIPLILKDYVEKRFQRVHADFDYILTQIGSKGLNELLTVTENQDTPISIKNRLIRIIANIGDVSSKQRLESLKQNITDVGLKMEINAALYQLGEKAYQKDIEDGLNNSNVGVRRTAARSMVLLTNPSTDLMVKALKDSDDQIRMDIATALQKHVEINAVDNLVDILTDNSSSITKKVVMETLNQYVEKGLIDGLAQRLITLLTTTDIPDHENRLRITQLLEKPALLKQIQETDIYENLPAIIYDYYESKETNNLVKDSLNTILLELDKQED